MTSSTLRPVGGATRARVLLVVVLLSSGAGCSGGGGGGGGAASEPKGPGGGATGVGAISFPAGALPAGTMVTVTASSDPATLDAFDDTASIYRPAARAGSFVRITTGMAQPTGNATVVLDVPAGVMAGVGQQLAVFGQVYWENDLETGDTFLLLDASPGAGAGKVAATVPWFVFTDARTGNGTMEALLLVAVIKTPPAAVASRTAAVAGVTCESALTACAASCVRTPLLRTLRGVRGLNLTPKNPKDLHPGADLRAESGQIQAVAVAGGTLIESRTSSSFGETVLIDTGVTFVRYAHLATGTRTYSDCCTPVQGNAQCFGNKQYDPCDAAVQEGEVLAYTDNTGQSGGPHLHLEMLDVYPKFIEALACLYPPDYHGHFTTTWVETAQGATFNATVTADATFHYAEADHDYEVQEGAWTFDLVATSLECTSDIPNRTGAIGQKDVTLRLGGVQNEQLQNIYLPATGQLPYVGGGLTQTPVAANYDCVVPGGGHVSGTFNYPDVTWWPLTMLSVNSPFHAEPFPNGGSPFEDFVEDNQPALLTSGSTPLGVTASWNVSAWHTP